MDEFLRTGEKRWRHSISKAARIEGNWAKRVSWGPAVCCGRALRRYKDYDESRTLAKGADCRCYQRWCRGSAHRLCRRRNRSAAFQFASRDWRDHAHRRGCGADQRRHWRCRVSPEIATTKRVTGLRRGGACPARNGRPKGRPYKRMKGNSTVKKDKIALLPDERVAIHAKLGSILKAGDPAEVLLVIILLLALRPEPRRKAQKGKTKHRRRSGAAEIVAAH